MVQIPAVNSQKQQKPCVSRRRAILVYTLFYLSKLPFITILAISSRASICLGVGSAAKNIFSNFSSFSASVVGSVRCV